MRSVAGHEKPIKSNGSSSSNFFLSSRRASISSSSASSSSNSNNHLRGIHINISSDPFQHRIPPYIQRLWQESKLRKHLSVWKRRLIKQYQQSGWLETIILGICVISGSIFLLVHVGFFSGKKYQDWQHEHYSEAFDEVDLLDKVYPDEGRSLTTAVILLDKYEDIEERTQPILKQLCQYDMFSNFIIWNDDPNMNITIDMIHSHTATMGCSPSRLSVVNAPAKMGSSARYQACRLSKTPYCYFQDITKQYPQQLRSTYANFLRSPHLIHAESINHSGFIDSQWRYCFANQDLDLHTCYISIELGTFVAKAMVADFLDNYDKASVVDKYADMYFTMYINQIPYQLEGGEGVKEQEEKIYQKELTDKEIEHMDLALTILHNDLEEEEGILPLKQPHLETQFDRNARTCCIDDRCLFLTNKQVLPKIDLFLYNPTIAIDTSKQMHDDFYKGESTRYSYAVDNNEKTSWKSLQNIHAGDYIGLDLLMPMRTSLKYRFLVRHPYEYKSTLNIQISYDGLLWIKLHPAPSVSCQNLEETENNTTIQLLECRFVVTDTGYRYIRLESQKNLDFGFDVYDFSFSAKVRKDANGQLLDIAFDEDGIAFVEDEI